ncbi:MAG: MarR family transcriptional regulator [Actinomycetaceae bacterium]|nr:MarR family transcriptional regulator [Actinomycetaceae bacterium]
MSEAEPKTPGTVDVPTMIGNVAALTHAQNTTLTALSKSVTPMTVAELASELGLHHNSVRETLDALVKRGLVARNRKAPEGRGRPSWVYEAIAPASLESFARQLTSMISALTDYLRENTDDPVKEAVKLGRMWGEEVMLNTGVPDHANIDHAEEAKRLDVHTSKVRLFLSSMGYGAAQTSDPHAFELRHCPLLGAIERGQKAGDKYPLACAMHRGLLEGVLQTTAHGHVGVELKAQVLPGVCSVRLTATEPSDSKPLSE